MSDTDEEEEKSDSSDSDEDDETSGTTDSDDDDEEEVKTHPHKHWMCFLVFPPWAVWNKADCDWLMLGCEGQGKNCFMIYKTFLVAFSYSF